MIFNKGRIAEMRKENKERTIKKRRLREAAKIAEKAAYQEEYRKSIIKSSIKHGKEKAREDIKKGSVGGFSGVVKSLQATGKRLNEMDRRRESSSLIPEVHAEKNKMIKSLWDDEEW